MRARTGFRPAGMALLCLSATMPLQAQTQRLLDAAAVTKGADHLDLSIDFQCSLNYQSHAPASEGDQLRVKLSIGADCGLIANAQFPADRLLPADSLGLVRSIELQPGLTGGAELLISWNRVEKFVLAPSAAKRGLRIRVLRPMRSAVVVGEFIAPAGNYAVNLASSRTPFSELEVTRAAAMLQAPVYVSAIVVEGEQWYRLRAGRFEMRQAADAVLRTALPTYPAAWMGIEDEATVDAPVDDKMLPSLTSSSHGPEMRADAALDRLLDEARTAMARKRFDDAIVRLTRLTAASDYVHRIDAAELLGLAHERKGQLAQAKAAYEDYLRRYPESRATGRIQQRLKTLRTASLPGRHGSGGGDSQEGWRAYGSASQVYRRDNTDLSTSTLSRKLTTQNALLSDVDGVVRHRGERYDFTARSNFGYTTDLLPSARGKPLRVSSVFVELNDRELALNARLGRQSRGMPGINGVFDGLMGNWQWAPGMGSSAAIGMPVESTRLGPDSKRYFMALATDFTSSNRHWDTSVYAIAQQYSGAADRRSIGVESRYLRPGRTLVTLADYDVHFGEINNALVLGTLVTDSRWTFNVDASRQRSPLLSIRNAMIGQPTLAFGDLTAQFTADELDQLAKDRSAQLLQFGLSASHPVGERVQWSINMQSVNLSGTPASGGVAAVLNPGRDDSVSTELLVNSLFRPGDTQSVALRYQRGDTGQLVSAGIGSRLPLGGALRLTSRLRVDRRSQSLAGGQELIIASSLRVDFQRGSNFLELEAGAELLHRGHSTASERSTRRFISAGYRLFLERNRE